MSWQRLNVFQRLTRQWDTLHPYNAAQALRLSPAPHDADIRRTWSAALRALSLDGAVRVRDESFRWETVANRSPENDFVNTTDQRLDELLTSELNRSFDGSDVELPFRPFMLRAPQGGCYIGVVYHHWVADSYSIRLLLREWFRHLFDPSAIRHAPLAQPRGGYWRWFGPERAKWRVMEATLDLFRWSSKFRRARRVEPAGGRELTVHFSLHHAEAGLIQNVVQTSKRLRVTVNDLFLAAMARACDAHVPLQHNPRRPDLGLGTIVDLRAAQAGLSNTFGLFLGFTSLFCTTAEMANDRLLIERIHAQNDWNKRTAAAESGMLRMAAGLIAAGILKRRGLLEFYRKRLPLAAGISNVNLNRDWPTAYHPGPLAEYIRVSPAGPMTPIVFTPTTLGEQLSIGLTCRASVLPAARVPALMESFLQSLREFNQLQPL